MTERARGRVRGREGVQVECGRDVGGEGSMAH